jgi:hypothetical protein
MLLRQVDDLRGQVRRARRLAETLSGNDRSRLIDLAKELEKEAMISSGKPSTLRTT